MRVFLQRNGMTPSGSAENARVSRLLCAETTGRRDGFCRPPGKTRLVFRQLFGKRREAGDTKNPTKHAHVRAKQMCTKGFSRRHDKRREKFPRALSPPGAQCNLTSVYGRRRRISRSRDGGARAAITEIGKRVARKLFSRTFRVNSFVTRGVVNNRQRHFRFCAASQRRAHGPSRSSSIGNCLRAH